MNRSNPTAFDVLWLTEAVRLREEQVGPLEDSEARRQVLAQGGCLEQRITTRAQWLSRREGLLEAQRSWCQGAQLALTLLLISALCGGAGLAFAALGDGQSPVNVFWALVNLLGLHMLTLLGWVIGPTASGEASGALGRLWLWLSRKLARDARVVHLAPALMILLGHHRLTRWALGLLMHGIWLLGLLAALALLLGLLATRRYSFVWETTIFGSDTFVFLTQALGGLPTLLGFPLPDAGMVRASGDSALASEAARHAWAGWLLGVLLVYGIFPRLLLWLFCLWHWRRGKARLGLDLNAPGYSLLRDHLMPTSERLGVNDAAPETLNKTRACHAARHSGSAVLVAVELDERHPWPPTLASSITEAGILDDGRERRRLLEQLTRHPAERLAIACDPRRSPDRGTLALLGELARCAADTRVWLLQAPPGEVLDSERLGDWHVAIKGLQLPYSMSSPLDWLETGHY